MISIHWLVSILLIIISFIFGFYIAIHSQQLNSITKTIQFIPLVTAMGASVSMIKVIADWFLNEKKKPSLAYDNIIRRGMKYYLRIKKIKGEELAKSVKWFVKVENTEINNIPTIWDFENNESVNIGEFKDIHLFTYNVPAIFFPIINNDFKNWYKTMLDKFETTNKILIRIESENAKVPSKPFIKSFDDIKSEAVDETIAKVEN